ncbi:hypothetical protein AOY38_10250 [Synechocystis sp. PCC 6803]|nr:hypothetical protein AOY38_10250 [Synechocystis sp. PCC 6803]
MAWQVTHLWVKKGFRIKRANAVKNQELCPGFTVSSDFDLPLAVFLNGENLTDVPPMTDPLCIQYKE